MKRIVKESLEEGVADRFLQQKNILPDEFDDFEKKIQTHNGTIAYTEGNWKLIKNPQTLEGFLPSVRGVITENGDLFLESHSAKIHNDLLQILQEMGVLPTDAITKNWTGKFPQETRFLTVQRYKDTQYVAIGESNRLLYDDASFEERREHYTSFMNMAREKCSGIEFIDKLVGTKSVIAGTKNTMHEHKL